MIQTIYNIIYSCRIVILADNRKHHEWFSWAVACGSYLQLLAGLSLKSVSPCMVSRWRFTQCIILSSWILPIGDHLSAAITYFGVSFTQMLVFRLVVTAGKWVHVCNCRTIGPMSVHNIGQMCRRKSASWHFVGLSRQNTCMNWPNFTLLCNTYLFSSSYSSVLGKNYQWTLVWTINNNLFTRKKIISLLVFVNFLPNILSSTNYVYCIKLYTCIQYIIWYNKHNFFKHNNLLPNSLFILQSLHHPVCTGSTTSNWTNINAIHYILSQEPQRSRRGGGGLVTSLCVDSSLTWLAICTLIKMQDADIIQNHPHLGATVWEN